MKVRYDKTEPSAVTGQVKYFKVEELPDGSALPTGGTEVATETPVTDWALLPLFGQEQQMSIKAPVLVPPSQNGGN